jgi:hypothetical protein
MIFLNLASRHLTFWNTRSLDSSQIAQSVTPRNKDHTILNLLTLILLGNLLLNWQCSTLRVRGGGIHGIGISRPKRKVKAVSHALQALQYCHIYLWAIDSRVSRGAIDMYFLTSFCSPCIDCKCIMP